MVSHDGTLFSGVTFGSIKYVYSNPPTVLHVFCHTVYILYKPYIDMRLNIKFCKIHDNLMFLSKFLVAMCHVLYNKISM